MPQQWNPESVDEVSQANRSSNVVMLDAPETPHKTKSDKRAAFMPPPRRSRGSKSLVIGATLLVAALIVAGYVSVNYFASGARAAAQSPPPVAATTGTASIITRPEGAEVVIDGVVRGIAPLKLSLSVGAHTLDLQNGADRRSLPLTIESGMIVSQYVDFAPSASASLGRLEITSEPAGAQVSVDGTASGVTPLALSSIAPGQHRIAISDGTTTVNRFVTVTGGATATVVASMAAAGPSAGWVTVKAPIELQILEDGRALGTNTLDRIMLPSGRHTLELTSAAFEFKASVTVQVPSGKTVTATIAVPNGALSINALPWADVWLDGQPLGTTPLGNLAVPIGNHEIVWKHPQLGERRQTVKVTARTPVRAGMDLSK